MLIALKSSVVQGGMCVCGGAAKKHREYFCVSIEELRVFPEIT
jgi:hypothetical protein